MLNIYSNIENIWNGIIHLMFTSRYIAWDVSMYTRNI